MLQKKKIEKVDCTEEDMELGSQDSQESQDEKPKPVKRGLVSLVFWF